MNAPGFVYVAPWRPVVYSSGITRMYSASVGLYRVPRISGWHARRRSSLIAGDKLYPDPLSADEFTGSTQKRRASSNSSEYLEQLNRASSRRVGRSQSQYVSKASMVGGGNDGENAGSGGQTGSSSSLALNYKPASRALWRVGWLTWWVQFLLTGVSAVIVGFALAFPVVDVKTAASAVGFVLATAAVVVALISLMWTYSYTRLSIWLSSDDNRNDVSESGSKRIGRRLGRGLSIALLGLVIATLGLQAIVGTVLGRLLTSGGLGRAASSSANVSAPVVQPVDVLVVQACANVVLALLTAVISTTWFQNRKKRWDEKASA